MHSRSRKWTIVFDLGLLIAANLLTLFFFLNNQTSVSQVLVTYFIQTVLIALFYFKRITKVNTTEVLKDLSTSSLHTKIAVLLNKDAQEQFFFILLFFVPLGFLFFLFSNGLFGASPLTLENLDYWSVGIASSVFLLHHVVSYFIEVGEYDTGRTDLLKIPYKKLVVRIVTIVAVSYVGLSISGTDGNTRLFVLFVSVKTLVDILCSSSLFLLRPQSNS